MSHKFQGSTERAHEPSTTTLGRAAASTRSFGCCPPIRRGSPPTASGPDPSSGRCGRVRSGAPDGRAGNCLFVETRLPRILAVALIESALADFDHLPDEPPRPRGRPAARGIVRHGSLSADSVVFWRSAPILSSRRALDDRGVHSLVESGSMRIFMFTSGAVADLHAFAGDEAGTKLPSKYGPWGLTGTLGSRQSPRPLLPPDHRAGPRHHGLSALADEAERIAAPPCGRGGCSLALASAVGRSGADRSTWADGQDPPRTGLTG